LKGDTLYQENYGTVKFERKKCVNYID